MLVWDFCIGSYCLISNFDVMRNLKSNISQFSIVVIYVHISL
uniref:Uncharacterized protein n=1 Tax=Arundo donax TaxID=35708 RepID=A0A0A9BAM7_ARUDO